MTGHPPSLLIVCIISAGLLLLAAIVWTIRGFAFGYPPAPFRCLVLSRKEQAIVAACADALFPPGGPIPVSGTQAGLVPYMDRYIARTRRTQHMLILLLLHFIEHSPWIFGPRRVRFTRLRAEERIAFLARMADSSIYFRRVAFLSLRTVLTMGYLAHDEVACAIGMTPCSAPFEALEAPIDDRTDEALKDSDAERLPMQEVPA